LTAYWLDRAQRQGHIATLFHVAQQHVRHKRSMKVAVTDYTFGDLAVETAILAPLKCEIVGRQARDEAELIELVRDADCVITQFATLSARVVESMQRARAIVRYGIGVDNVDLAAARAKGIAVCNVPDYCIDEVADHTLGLLLALTRRIVAGTNYIRGGNWGAAAPLESFHSLKQLNAGIVGFGRIGREVARRLLAFKCPVSVFDPQVPAEEISRAGCQPSELASLLETCDVVSLHCPSTAATRGMIDAARLARFKLGSLLINVARGDLVDTAALVEALRSGQLSGAGLDVSNPEPIPAGHPLRSLENVVFTAHIASASVPAVKRLRTCVAETAACALRGDPLSNVVNGVASPAR
jgi:D-3-phosphoglycerate dehydrogenase / 2-oxoglutarate reductase